MLTGRSDIGIAILMVATAWCGAANADQVTAKILNRPGAEFPIGSLEESVSILPKFWDEDLFFETSNLTTAAFTRRRCLQIM